MYQVSTSTALVEGVYSGSVSSSILLEHGDFGLGTFEGLSGEMVVLDGRIYQIACEVQLRSDDFLVPFAAVTRFHADGSFEVEQFVGLKDLEKICDRRRQSDNLFYALRLDGSFRTLHARAVHPVPRGTRLLEAAKAEFEFQFHDIEGTIVGIWSPRYSSSFSVPGYHFHFISTDRTKGGHVLDCSAQQLRASIQTVSEYTVVLPPTGPFLTTNLDKDPASDLAKAE